MTRDKLPKEYMDWMKDEHMAANEAYSVYKAQGTRHKAQVGSKEKVLRNKVLLRPFFLRIAAAAVLILALGFSMWIKRDDIFKPKYTEEQIGLAYEHALKGLAVCSNSLNSEMSKLKKLGEIPKSLENIKKLETVINN